MKPSSTEHPSQPEPGILDYEWFKQGCLSALRQSVSAGPYKDYPAERLSLPEISADYNETLPDGPWTYNNIPLPSFKERHTFTSQGYKLDSVGRPLHPWLEDMLTDPDIGVVTGKGFYWQWGANKTVDPIVIRHDLSEPHLLVIRRKDTGAWALPGGFHDTGETKVEGAMREAWEESEINLHMLRSQVRQVYEGPLSDPRITAHAWPETTAFRFDVWLENKYDKRFLTEMMGNRRWKRTLRSIGQLAFNEQTNRIPWKGRDDADKAKWLPISKLDDELFGAHRLLVKLALQQD